MKKTIGFALFLIIASVFGYGQNAVVTPDDFKMVVGCWKGTLTYLDYTSGKPFSMPANVDIQPLGKSGFTYSKTYPNEPQANGVDSLFISEDGIRINNQLLVSKSSTATGNVEIITELQGVDGNDNKPATFRYSYILAPELYIQKKEVRFNGTTNWITRHEYRYNPCP